MSARVGDLLAALTAVKRQAMHETNALNAQLAAALKRDYPKGAAIRWRHAGADHSGIVLDHPAQGTGLMVSRAATTRHPAKTLFIHATEIDTRVSA